MWFQHFSLLFSTKMTSKVAINNGCVQLNNWKWLRGSYNTLSQIREKNYIQQKMQRMGNEQEGLQNEQVGCIWWNLSVADIKSVALVLILSGILQFLQCWLRQWLIKWFDECYLQSHCPKPLYWLSPDWDRTSTDCSCKAKRIWTSIYITAKL